MKFKNVIAVILLTLVSAFSTLGFSSICVYQDASGRITDEFGNGVSAQIQVTSLLEIDPVDFRVTRSNSFGYYTVPNLVTCENYEFRAVSNRYAFTPESLLIVPIEQSSGIDFTASETMIRKPVRRE